MEIDGNSKVRKNEKKINNGGKWRKMEVAKNLKVSKWTI